MMAIKRAWNTQKILWPVPTAATASAPNDPTALMATKPTDAKSKLLNIEGHANPHTLKDSG